MLFLLRLNIGKKPAPAPSSVRVRSPSIGSTLITSAPRSASTMPQVGPITMWVNSTTRRPAQRLRQLRSCACMRDSLMRQPAASSAARRATWLPCSVSPSSHCASRARKRDQRARSRGRWARPCSRTGRRRLRWPRCRSRPAHAGSRRCRRGRHRSGARRSAMRRRRWPGRGRACRGSGRSARLVAGDFEAPARTSALHLQRVGIAHGVGQADALGAGVERALDQAQHLVGLDAALDRAAERGARCRPRSRSASPRASRRSRDAARSRPPPRRASCAGWPGCARGWPTAAAASRARPTSIARSAPFRFGTSTEVASPGSVRAKRHQLGGVGQLRQQLAAARTSRPRSRAGRRRTRARSHSQLVFGGQRARQDLQAVAQADLAHDHRCAGFRRGGSWSAL